MFRLFAVLAIIALPLLACAVSSKVTSTETYRDDAFTSSSLASGGLAILPVVAGEGVEGYRRPFGEALNHMADSIFVNVIPWQETMDLLNDAEIVSEYNEAIESYGRTAILDRSLLTKMYESTGTQYFLYVLLAPPSADRRVSYNALTGVTATETKTVGAFGQIWDTTIGDVVWEGGVDATVTTGNYSYTSETTMDRALKAANALMLLLQDHE